MYKFIKYTTSFNFDDRTLDLIHEWFEAVNIEGTLTLEDLADWMVREENEKITAEIEAGLTDFFLDYFSGYLPFGKWSGEIEIKEIDKDMVVF